MRVQQARQEIDQAAAAAGSEFREVGSTVDAVYVHLRADQADLAVELVRRYGDLVTVTLGNFSYPDARVGPSVGYAACEVRYDIPTEVHGLRAVVRLSEGSVRAGADFAGTITVTNTGTAPLHFDSGAPLAGAVVEPGTTRVAASYDSAIAGVGISADLAPGASRELPALFGTASCDPGVGYALPPGGYEVLVVVPISLSEGTNLELLTSSAPLTVTG